MTNHSAVKRVYIVMIGIIVVLALFFIFHPTSTSVQAGRSGISKQDTLIAHNLSVPWQLVFLPDGDLLVTERDGTLLRQGKINQQLKVPKVQATGEGGLLGMALDPEFTTNHYLYLFRTTQQVGALKNQIVRFEYNPPHTLSHETVLLDNIPAASTHNGGRIAFGPDNNLYITTGDAEHPENSQLLSSLSGKILRITKDGHPAPGNPFDNEIYSYGHRNPEGLAWDNQQRLWSIEHGQSYNDEVNLIQMGHNYGWPLSIGKQAVVDITPPILSSGSQETWAPAGAAILNNKLFFTGLRGQTLYEMSLDFAADSTPQLRGHLREQYGRLRDVVIGPDGFLYVLTSNRDGRGVPSSEDDKIIRINPATLKGTDLKPSPNAE